ncbi:hypothetical protein CEXT_36151 [Caerostris extrusa]|uniref:Uncharacterized protein n=1 Tax=Caerostris extrusa TaxID=172846 RepID=A0AAV4MIM9_CAEEX|nr:hypothetical protein CEXT_36151 [Caerostris extrusa]
MERHKSDARCEFSVQLIQCRESILRPLLISHVLFRSSSISDSNTSQGEIKHSQFLLPRQGGHFFLGSTLLTQPYYPSNPSLFPKFVHQCLQVSPNFAKGMSCPQLIFEGIYGRVSLVVLLPPSATHHFRLHCSSSKNANHLAHFVKDYHLNAPESDRHRLVVIAARLLGARPCVAGSSFHNHQRRVFVIE